MVGAGCPGPRAEATGRRAWPQRPRAAGRRTARPRECRHASWWLLTRVVEGAFTWAQIRRVVTVQPPPQVPDLGERQLVLHRVFAIGDVVLPVLKHRAALAGALDRHDGVVDAVADERLARSAGSS